MRYWPLTAVLLAFWLGRETGAGDDGLPTILRVDRIEASEVVTGSLAVAADTRFGGGTRIDRMGILVASPNHRGFQRRARLTPRVLEIGRVVPVRPSEPDGVKRHLPLVKVGDVASMEMGGVAVYNDGGRSTVVASGGRTDHPASVSVRDQTGRNRAILGSVHRPPGKNGAIRHGPESAVTLFDEHGTVVDRLPR